MWQLLVLCSFMVTAGLGQAQTKLVIAPQGPILGHKAPNFDVFQFYNVPYATAPTGPNKFKAPLPRPVWTETFDAVNRNILCPQSDAINAMIDFEPNFTEDCLVANIYIPDTNQTNLPVLVSVHHGAFQMGFGAFDTPRALVNSKKIIAVTFNYRLGPHGFLCLGTEDAPGNAGMKDQVALLRWVRTNIASFGGNPNDVTLHGCSAGGASVDTLMVSSMTDGLFNKIIVGSACSISPFATQLKPLQNAKYFANFLNFTNVDDIDALTKFYQSLPFDVLNGQSFVSQKDSYFFFQPCLERDVGQERFLEEAPINILKSGNYKKLPSMYGFATMEGMFRLTEFDEYTKEMNKNFSQFLPANLEFDNEEQKAEIAKNIKEYYFGDNLINESSVLDYIDFFTDTMFIYSSLRAVTLQVKAGNDQIYLYDYSFIDTRTDPIPYTDGIRGATHCEQTFVMFDLVSPDDAPADLLQMADIMRELVLNFITTGNPTPPGWSSVERWPPTGADRSPIYSFGSTIGVAGPPIEKSAKLWDAIYERYGAIPQPPPKQ